MITFTIIQLIFLLFNSEICNSNNIFGFIKNNTSVLDEQSLENPFDRYDYIEKLFKDKKYEKIAEILSNYNNGEDNKQLNRKYYEKRKYVAYYMLKQNKPKLAYKVASKCSFIQSIKNEEKARIKWLLGFISYKFLDRLDLAKEHFKEAYYSSEDDSRKSKNAFWLAEIYLSENDILSSIYWYKKAHEYFYTFYGFLADKRLCNIQNKYLDPVDLSFNKSISTMQVNARDIFNNRELAIKLRNKSNNKKYREDCYDKLIEKIKHKPYEHLLLLELAEDNGEYELVLKKINSRINHHLEDKKYYKTLNEDEIKYIEEINKSSSFISITHSIIKQESLFDAKASGCYGESGLMQLMSFTAEKEAKKLDIKIEKDDLYKTSINLKLGCNYLNGLLQLHNNNIVHTLYEYNAGPENLQKYKDSIDKLKGLSILDKIELIPINGTRRYIKYILMNKFYYDQIFLKYKSKNEIIQSVLYILDYDSN